MKKNFEKNEEIFLKKISYFQQNINIDNVRNFTSFSKGPSKKGHVQR